MWCPVSSYAARSAISRIPANDWQRRVSPIIFGTPHGLARLPRSVDQPRFPDGPQIGHRCWEPICRTAPMLELPVVFSGGGSRAASLHGGKTSASEGCCWAVDCGAAETSSTATAAAAKNSRKCESKVSKIISVLFWTQPRPVVLASKLRLQTAPRFQSWAGFAARSRNIVTCGSVPTSRLV